MNAPPIPTARAPDPTGFGEDVLITFGGVCCASTEQHKLMIKIVENSKDVQE
jgi:hypothetical protein